MSTAAFPWSRTMLSYHLWMMILVVGTLLGAGGGWTASVATAAQPADPERLTNIIDRALDDPDFDGTHWGVVVIDLEADSLVYDRNPRTRMLPASNVKLYTAAAALDQLGPDYRYETPLYAAGLVRADTLHGDLIVRGSGDPTVGHEDAHSDTLDSDSYDPTTPMQAWADSLQVAGITHITGDLVGDASWIQGPPLGRGWTWDNTPFGYSAEMSGLVFNQNTIDLTVTGQRIGKQAWLHTEPATDFVELDNHSLTIPASAEGTTEVDRLLGRNTIEVRSHVPAGSIDDHTLAVTQPNYYFTQVFHDVLGEAGITVDGEQRVTQDPKRAPSYEGLPPLTAHQSPPLAEIVREFNQESDNLYAEQVLRTLGAERPIDEDEVDDDVVPGSTEMGVAAAMRTLDTAPVDTSAIQWADGSGLSRHNQKPPLATAELLRYMWSHPNEAVRSAFLDSLPLGGEDGTLSYRFQRQAPANRNVRAKTGTLANVSSLSGYVTTNGGTPLAFAIMCNHHLTEASRVREAQDLIINALARQGW